MTLKLIKAITPEMIAKLPLWAQGHIDDLTRERDLAVQELKETLDNQTPSNVYFDDTITVEGPPWLVARRYVQTHKITMNYGGVCVQLSCDSYRLPEQQTGKIKVDYWAADDKYQGAVLIQPTSYRMFEICLPEKAK